VGLRWLFVQDWHYVSLSQKEQMIPHSQASPVLAPLFSLYNLSSSMHIETEEKLADTSALAFLK